MFQSERNLHQFFTGFLYSHCQSLNIARGNLVSTSVAFAIVVERQETGRSHPDLSLHRVKLEARDLCFCVRQDAALFNVNTVIPERCVAALIGPSGCGKSTFLRTLNRMNELIDGTRHTGRSLSPVRKIYGRGVVSCVCENASAWCFRSRIRSRSPCSKTWPSGRVAGLSNHGRLAEIVERSLKQAALWDELKDRLTIPPSIFPAASSNGSASPARWRPRRILLMDEPASARPAATRIEDLIYELRQNYDRHRDAQHATSGAHSD